jgi:hypothetical protein
MLYQERLCEKQRDSHCAARRPFACRSVTFGAPVATFPPGFVATAVGDTTYLIGNHVFGITWRVPAYPAYPAHPHAHPRSRHTLRSRTLACSLRHRARTLSVPITRALSRHQAAPESRGVVCARVRCAQGQQAARLHVGHVRHPGARTRRVCRRVLRDCSVCMRAPGVARMIRAGSVCCHAFGIVMRVQLNNAARQPTMLLLLCAAQSTSNGGALWAYETPNAVVTQAFAVRAHPTPRVHVHTQ